MCCHSGWSEDVEFTTTEVDGGFQADLRIHCLPTDMRTTVFAGPLCASSREAVHGVSSIAYEAIMADPVLKEMHDAGCKITRSRDGWGDEKSSARWCTKPVRHATGR